MSVKAVVARLVSASGARYVIGLFVPSALQRSVTCRYAETVKIRG